MTGSARNPGIDLLRGLSIVLVVTHHLGLRVSLKSSALADVVPRRLLEAITGNGYESVFVFFVISGFLITSNSLARWGSLARIDIRAFYVRRAARIVPLLLALLAVLSTLHLLGAADYVIHRAGQSLPRALLAALGLHLNWYEGFTGYLPGGWDVLWSLSIEEVFYLAFPLVCRVLGDRALVPPLVILALSLPATRAALHGNEIWQEKAYLPGMAGIATGVLAAWLAPRLRLEARAAQTMLVAGASGLLSVLLIEDVLWHALGNGTMLVLTLSSALLVLGFHGRESGLASAPGVRWLRSFGRLSYEIYLTHMFVVLAGVRLFRAVGASTRFGFVAYVPSLIVCWLLGAAVERFFSAPSEAAIRARLLT